MLGAVAGDTIELAFGDFQLTLGQGNQGLYSALAEGAVTDDYAALTGSAAHLSEIISGYQS